MVSRLRQRDPQSCLRADVAAHQLLAVTMFLRRFIQHSLPSVTIASFSPPTKAAAALLTGRLHEMMSRIPNILEQHKVCFTLTRSASLKMGLEGSLLAASQSLPFLEGRADPGTLRYSGYSMGYMLVGLSGGARRDCSCSKTSERGSMSDDESAQVLEGESSFLSLSSSGLNRELTSSPSLPNSATR